MHYVPGAEKEAKQQQDRVADLENVGRANWSISFTKVFQRRRVVLKATVQRADNIQEGWCARVVELERLAYNLENDLNQTGK